MSYKRLTNTKRLFFSQEALTIAQTDTIIAAILLKVGYTPEAIGEGLTLYTDAFTAATVRQVKFGEQVVATKAVNTLFKQLKSQFSRDRRLVRGLLARDRASYEPYGLNRRIQDNREAFISQAAFFYREVEDATELLSALSAQYGMTSAIFEERRQGIEGLVEAMRIQQTKRAEAQVATQRRREAMARLDDWMVTFVGIARQAFKEDRKQLEKLGLAVKVDV